MNEIHRPSIGPDAERVTEAEKITNEELCVQVNQELQPGKAAVTESAYTDYKHPASRIYKLGDDGQLELHGEIVTLGAEYPFMGDEVQIIDGTLVVVNHELRLGLSAEKVKVIDVEQDEADRGRSLGGSTTQRFTEELLPLIDRVSAGDYAEFDCNFI